MSSASPHAMRHYWHPRPVCRVSWPLSWFSPPPDLGALPWSSARFHHRVQARQDKGANEKLALLLLR